MRIPALIIAAFLALATPAGAQLYAAWNTCEGTQGSVSSIGLDCRPGSDYVVEMFGTFGYPALLPNVYAADLVLDFSFPDNPDVPPFWHFEQGGCNPDGVQYTMALATSRIPCDAINGSVLCGASGELCQGGMTGYVTDTQVPLGGANRSRLLATHLRPSTRPVVLPALPARTFAFRLAFIASAGSSCSGCETVARVTWNLLILYNNQVSSPPEGVAAIIDAIMPGSTGPLFINDYGTATRPTSWGRLKSLYR